MKTGQPLEEPVLSFIKEHQLVASNQRLLVAVSGGADSVCLLYVLYGLRGRLGVALHVAHLNHGLRGAEADADAAYVSELAQSLGIPATIERRDVEAYQARESLSLEEAAREVRYAFLGEVAGSIGASCIAVGHTLDDHIETVLMHLVRGTGIRGLCGLQPLTERRLAQNTVVIIRPLLQVSREKTAGYCLRHRLSPRIDTSNLSLSPLRNRIRHQLLPLLQRYNPQVVEALERTARIAGDDVAFLEEQAARLWGGVARKRGNTVILDRGGFCRLSPVLQRYLLREVIENLAGSIRDVEMRHIDGIMAAMGKPAGRSLNLPLGLTFYVEHDRFLIGKDPAAFSPFPVLGTGLALNVPGETRLPGWRIRAEITSPSAKINEVAKPPQGLLPPLSFEGEEDKGDEVSKSYKAFFDLDRIGNELVVRPRWAGDRFQPLGMGQPKKLNEFMIDARIPRPWRQRVPLVCSLEHILWVVGWRIDDRVKVTEATRRVLELEFERVSDRLDIQS